LALGVCSFLLSPVFACHHRRIRFYLRAQIMAQTAESIPEWLAVVLLGIIEGITEFLPVSSTGHLLLAQQWLDARSDVFNVVIQSGAVLAVLFVFKERSLQIAQRWRERETQDYIFKMGTAFAITCAGGLILKITNFELPDEAKPVAISLIVGGVIFVFLEMWIKGKALSETITWPIAVAIGFGQLVAAVFPGASRSGTTIVIAMAMGLNRRMAVEFTFLLGVPTLLAAGAVKMLSAFKDGVFSEDIGMLVLGTVISAIVAFISVKWLLTFLQKYTFIAFGWYRIILGALVLMFVK
jgi:undecaprenyl-diphosphatase